MAHVVASKLTVDPTNAGFGEIFSDGIGGGFTITLLSPVAVGRTYW